jgi:hypothetical protein
LRQRLIILITIIFSSCNVHQYNNSTIYKVEFDDRKNAKSDTLIVEPKHCSECTDLTILGQQIAIPTDIQTVILADSTKYIRPSGNFPVDLVDMRNLNYIPGASFRIIGKIIGADTNYINGICPLFYVEKWEELNIEN